MEAAPTKTRARNKPDFLMVLSHTPVLFVCFLCQWHWPPHSWFYTTEPAEQSASVSFHLWWVESSRAALPLESRRISARGTRCMEIDGKGAGERAEHISCIPLSLPPLSDSSLGCFSPSKTEASVSGWGELLSSPTIISFIFSEAFIGFGFLMSLLRLCGWTPAGALGTGWRQENFAIFTPFSVNLVILLLGDLSPMEGSLL